MFQRQIVNFPNFITTSVHKTVEDENKEKENMKNENVIIIIHLNLFMMLHA